MQFKQDNLKIEEIITAETKRLSEKYMKDFLSCEDLIKITGLGRDNVRMMMRSKGFPTTRVGNRQVVSVAAFAAWQFKETINGVNYG